MKGIAYLIQATLVSLWWIGLLLNRSFYDAFQFPNISNTAFNSLMLPDLGIIALLSIIRAYNNKKELEYIILGGFAFASLYCINATILTHGGALPTTIMVLGLAYNLFILSDEKIFRIAKTDNFTLNLVKTIIQIICVWILTLVLFPIIILNSFGVEIPNIDDFNLIGFIFFIVFSIIGLYSAYIMVKDGKGTPLPLDQTQKLVVKGPYRIVRNPMAVAGIGQGISISIMIQSIHILIYSLLGAILWQYVVRPLEEKDMINRFGKEYVNYKETVNCWLPKLKHKTKV